MKATKVLAACFSMLSIANPATIHATPETDHCITVKDGKEMIKEPPVRTRRKFSIPEMIGGIQMINAGHEGISPKIYGQYYVKRGTHKRTNK